MARRSSSLNQIDSGLSREIGSNFDLVRAVASKLADIEKVGASALVSLTAEELTALAALTGVAAVAAVADSVATVGGSALVTLTYADWLALLDITGAAQLIQNLNVQAESLPAGDAATATLVGNQLTIGVPRAVNGLNGRDGLTPVVSLSVDANYNLLYDVAFVESDTITVTPEEW